mgnify:CR=1 FL=1
MSRNKKTWGICLTATERVAGKCRRKVSPENVAGQCRRPVSPESLLDSRGGLPPPRTSPCIIEKFCILKHVLLHHLKNTVLGVIRTVFFCLRGS